MSSPRLGAFPTATGVEVAVQAPDADLVEWCTFDHGHETRHRLTRGDGGLHTGHVTGAGIGTRYGLRAHGRFAPGEGRWVNPAKLLVDPAARRVEGRVRIEGPVFPAAEDDPLRPDERDSAPFTPRGVVVADDLAAPSRRPSVAAGERLIYETHLRGHTMCHPAVPPELRGTYAGFAHPAVIEHLVCLGVTTVELLPIAAFADEPHLARRGLTNWWGYNPYAWAAPHPRYAATDDPVAEARAMVAALHEAGLEVVLDVVFNHTAEGDRNGPLLGLRGLDNHAYHLDPGDPGRYVDHAGTGSAVDLSHPGVVDLVIDALVWWSAGIGVDGFRFDLLATLLRAGSGGESPFLEAVAAHPLLRDRLLIAEAWDIGPGGYRVGALPAPWLEWNDRFRDDGRDLWRGALGAAGRYASAVAGSAGTFAHRPARTSVNFVTAHDGFTLADLVAYNHKHNEANGEDNRDGSDHDRSWNCGVEGPTDDRVVMAVRDRQQRNLLTALVLSVGTPMLLAGDELGRTQEGNNNAYCHDSGLTWIDWDAADLELVEFVRSLVAIRRSSPALLSEKHPTVDDLTWWAPDGSPMDEGRWHDPGTRAFGCAFTGGPMLWWNPTPDPVDFTVPPVAGAWSITLSSGPIGAPGSLTSGDVVSVLGHSSVVLVVASAP